MKIAIIGLGHLGAAVLDNVLRIHGPHEIVVAVRDPDRLAPRVNLAILSASALGVDHQVERVQVDLMNVDQTASFIAASKPDILFNSATLQAIWTLSALPKPVYERLYAAEIGPWLPMHLTLAHRLMIARRDSGYESKVINASVPDIVNAVLGRVGLAPETGIGNVGLVEPAIRRAVALLLGAKVTDTQVSLVMHHYVSNHAAVQGVVGDAPWILRARVAGVDRTGELNPAEVLSLLPARFSKPGGVLGMGLTAATAAALIESVANDTGERLHVPGPLGLPGGYPVTVDKGGVALDLPDGVTVDHAREVNERAGVYDGIETIDSDGTVTFAEQNMEIMREVLGYRCRRMSLDESEDRAAELAERFKRLVQAS